MGKQRLGQSAHHVLGQILGPSPDTDKATGRRAVSRDARDDQLSGERPAGTGQLFGSLAITLISVGMLLGSFLLSQLDASGVRPPATSVAQIWPSPTLSLSTDLPPSPSPTEAISSPSPAAETATPSPTLSSPLIPPGCSPPSGWVAYTVQQEETLYSLAWKTGVTALALMQANCLSAPTIYPGQQIYLPPTLYASPTPWPFLCGPPLGWVAWYTVQPGDTVFSLSQSFGVSMEEIRRANCLSGYTIYVGTVLYLPPLTPTPVHTPTLPPTPTHTPTGTSTPTFTWTPTPTEFASVTPSLTPTATATLTSTVTHTPTPTPTPIDSPTPTSTPTPTPTGSPAPTYTPTPTPTEFSTPTPTSTLSPTSTPTETPIFTPMPTATPTPSGG